MRVLENRITISLFAISALAFIWEFHLKPDTGPLYTAAVAEYKHRDYDRSLALLQKAYRFDPNDTAILTLMGWDYLKLGDARSAEPKFQRAHKLAPNVTDALLGYAYAEITLKKYGQAANLLTTLRQRGAETADVHLARGTLYREVGRNRDAAREFQMALALDRNNTVAVKNLEEIYNVWGDIRQISLEFQPLVRAKELTYPARVEGEYFAWQVRGEWKAVYLAGVDLTAALPGHFPADSVTDPNLYADWFLKMSALGANTIRVYTILPPAFYRALFQFNNAHSREPLWVLQGISFGDPPHDDLFNSDYYAACQKEIRDTLDVIHGQGDVGATYTHAGGIFNRNVAPWVTGLIVGQTWLPHVVIGNNQRHPDLQNYQGSYLEVPSGSPTEIFLARMINYAAEYEENKYNWQHPLAFLSWPTLDPMRHPTESTLLEEISIRRALGERFPTPAGPYDDDDSVALDPMHLRARESLRAGYFAAYSVFPFYPDFINRDPRFQEARDAEGYNPFFGYLLDLKAYHRGLPLLIADYGISTSLGIGHFSPAGFDQGGQTEEQQGKLLARLTRNVFDAGAAGGMVFEWLDQWFRQSWLVRDYETPQERTPLWTNFMDPAEHFGLLAADPHHLSVHRLGLDASEWENIPPVYAHLPSEKFQPLGDRYDPARNLKALYADADEGFLYLRLVVDKLDNDHDSQPDWKQANYLIGIATAPGRAGLTYLPFIAPVRFPMGMTYAIQLSGPESSRIWIASSYNPYQIIPVDGVPAQTVLVSKPGWKAELSETGSFVPQVIEPNRRRFAPDGEYFPPQRYDRGLLRYGSLDPQASDYDPLGEWHASIRTNTVDLRIPWNLLNVTDPSSLKVVAGLDREGKVKTAETPGFLMVAFSYRPLETSRVRPIMEQGHPIADALPGMAGPATILSAALKEYRWPGWNTPRYNLRPKASLHLLRRAFLSLPAPMPASERSAPQIAQRNKLTRESKPVPVRLRPQNETEPRTKARGRVLTTRAGPGS